MSNKNPATGIVNIPSKFKPLLQRELEEKGLYGYVELMNQILSKHYGEKGWLDEKKPAAAKEIVRG